MKRLLLLAVVGLTLVTSQLAADEVKRQQAWELLRSAQDLVKAGKYDEAERKILTAKDLDSRYPDVYANLGYLYTSSGDRAKALDAYGELLTLKPDHEYGRQAVKRLFYDGQFPRQIKAPYLAFSGVAFATDEVQALIPTGPTTRRLAYTTSLLYHEDMGRGQGPVKIPVPVTGNASTCLVNRSCYGYVLPPDSDRYTLAFSMSWPSEIISATGERSYSTVAPRLTHLLLRFYWYSKLYLNRDFPEGSTLTRCFMCEQGPAGAETYKDGLYFYDVATARPAIEWARQAAHELGHLVLPQIGRFTRPESFASGYLGERLFLQYLALEAGLVAGEPWPSQAAQKAVGALWPGEDFALAQYITQNCRTALDYWLAAGPESPLAAGTGEEAMKYFTGFILWTEAAFGTQALRTLSENVTNQTTAPADYILGLKTYLRKQAEKGSIVVDAGSLNLPAARLSEKPLEGALGRTEVKLAAGDNAPYVTWLPAGAWTLTVPGTDELAVTIDGKGPLPLKAGTPLPLGRLEDGWHTITVQLPDKAAPVTLQSLVFKPDREA